MNLCHCHIKFCVFNQGIKRDSKMQRVSDPAPFSDESASEDSTDSETRRVKSAMSRRVRKID